MDHATYCADSAGEVLMGVVYGASLPSCGGRRYRRRERPSVNVSLMRCRVFPKTGQ